MEANSTFGSNNKGVQIGTYLNLSGRIPGVPQHLGMIAKFKARKA